ncbi:hypothetical protein CERSUDRAFT_116505 [Gelatoporia subvermispora B]|uniref:Ubinuclein middle domain-containing protein n=1 Tax=Ceriporiopsis subvermispora (strain B) TaxID=914234 RepID=M2QD70_CERS8|nr:hypothetical protein CERSUDRAFT_116505 [Gelatoporia subvermispora B]
MHVDSDSSASPALLPPTISINGGSSSDQTTPAEPDGGDVVRDKKSRPPSSDVTAKPASTAAGAKPKSTKSAARSPSPSPPPPPAREPLQTIRLEIRLGGPEDYEVDISSLSKTTGQRPPTPVAPSKPDTSDDSHSEGDDEGDGKKEKKKRRRRKNHASEYYDTTDPFIDDSELAQDERTFFAQTKQKGFYVSSGQVALMNKTPSKKPKSKKVNILAPSASISAALSSASLPPSIAGTTVSALVSSSKPNAASTAKKTKQEDGTRDSPIALYSDAEEDRVSHGIKRKSSDLLSVSASLNGSDTTSKKRRKEVHPFSDELEAEFELLKEAIAKENWETKGKFPPSMKPILAKVALKAIILGEYDDNFFNAMPRLFPYNKFTMTKLIKRTIWKDHQNLLIDRQNALIEELAVLAKEGFPKAKEEWEKSVSLWERRQERAKAEADAGTAGHSVEGTPAATDSQHPTPKLPTSTLASRISLDEGGNDTGLEHDEAKGKSQEGRETHPPAQRYRLTDTMKQIIWQLVCLSNECCRIENEKNALEGVNQVVSDQGVRKSLYQKIVAAFPEGWLSSGQISREVSVMKKKYEKEVMENEA